MKDSDSLPISADVEPPLPAKFAIIKPWPYGAKWVKENFGSFQKIAELDTQCDVPGAGIKAEDFFTHYLSKSFEKIVTQNTILSKIKRNSSEAEKMDRSCVDWQMGWTWSKVFELVDALRDIYNIESANEKVKTAFDFTVNYLESARQHAEQLIAHIEYHENLRKKKIQEQSLSYRSRTRPIETDEVQRPSSATRDPASDLWNIIDAKHAAVEHGFIYVLSNILMPGVYKVGFTANNPDKRAAEISRQYGLPSPFVVVKYWRTADPYIVEQRIHTNLSDKKKSGEFFEVDLEDIIQVVDRVLIL